MYIRSLFAGLLLTFVATSAFGYEMRMWTAMNGKTTEAAYVKYESDTMKVVMQQRDGSIIKVDRDALCDEDWVYVMQYDPSIFSLWIKLGEPTQQEIRYLKDGHLPRLFAGDLDSRTSVFVSSDGFMCIQEVEPHSASSSEPHSARFPVDETIFDSRSFIGKEVQPWFGGYPKEHLFKTIFYEQNSGCLILVPDLHPMMSSRGNIRTPITYSGENVSVENAVWLYDIEIGEGRIHISLNTQTRVNSFVSLDSRTRWKGRSGFPVFTPGYEIGFTAVEWEKIRVLYHYRREKFLKIPRYKRIDAILASKQAGAPKESLVPATTKLKATGSGFFITEDGFFLTNYHVVEGSRKIELMTNSGIKKSRIVRIEPDVDLALLKVEDHGFVPLPFAANESTTLGEDIFTIGFPIPSLQGFSPKMTKGVISSLNGLQDSDVHYQIDASIQPGNSGGPLVNNQGELVGVVVASLKEGIVIQKTGALPQNVNYAIKKKHVLDFLSQVPDCYDAIITTHLPVTGKSATPETIQAVQNSCAMVIVFE